MKSRVQFERKLCQLLMEEEPAWYAQRTGGSSNASADVELLVPTGDVWMDLCSIEVKTSVKSKKSFTSREKKQLKNYRRVHREHGIVTVYAYRWVTYKKDLTDRDKWRFFHINSVRNGGVSWSDGMTWKTFIRKLKEELDERRK